MFEKFYPYNVTFTFDDVFDVTCAHILFCDVQEYVKKMFDKYHFCKALVFDENGRTIAAFCDNEQTAIEEGYCDDYDNQDV